MIVEAMLPAARERLILLGDEAPLIDAARLLPIGPPARCYGSFCATM